jgi:PKD repeat protein
MKKIYQIASVSAVVVLFLILVSSTASATGNVKINDFTSNITKGTVPFEARLTGYVTGEVTKWQWDFYNPQIKHWSYSTGNRTTSHTFGRAGAYGVFNVTLIVSGPGGTDSLKKIDYVIGNKNATGLPVASFSASSTRGNAPLTVTFTDKSTSATSSIWYFGLDRTSKEKNPTFTFTSPGTYRVVLEVSNSRGWDATAQEITVTQNQVAPSAAFSASSTKGNTPLAVTFTDQSTGSPNSWKWSFGDGSPLVMGYNPTHTYTKAGVYTVKETVSNSAGTNTAIKTNYITVTVLLKPPGAAFTASPTTGKHPLSVKFTDKSTGLITSRSWNFGDKTASTVKSPVHKYTKAGKYTVTLKVKNAAGSNTKTMSITVK